MTRTLTLMISAAGVALLSACSAENQIPADEELTNTAEMAADDVGARMPDVDMPAGDDPAEAADDEDGDREDAAGLPTTDIYLADLGWTGNIPAVTNVRNVTRHAGYDNQPAFLPGGTDFYYASESESGLADVRLFATGTGESEQVTSTPDSGEYSPRTFGDDSGLYFVRQASDGTTQHLVRADMDGSNPDPVLDLTTIGYYAFNADRSQVALFVLGESFTLQVADVASGDVTVVAEDIGRALYATPDGSAAIFTTGRDDGGFRAMLYDFASGETEYLFDLPGTSQDFALAAAPDGLSAAFATDERTLYFRDANSADWTAVADISSFGLEGVTRMAVSDDGTMMAFVANDRAY